MKLTRIEQSTLAKTIFATLAITALVGTMLIFPSLGYIIKYFSEDKKRYHYVKRVFRNLEKQKLINIHEGQDGKITIVLTEFGKQKALTYHLDTIAIKRKEPWDKLWRVVIFDIPEGKKQSRNLFRRYLLKLDFLRLQKSVFVQAFPCKNEVDFLKHNLQIADNVSFIQARFIENESLLRNHFRV